MSLHEELGIDKEDAENYFNNIVEIIKTSLLDGEQVKIGGLGVFEVREFAARNRRNPKTGEKIECLPGKRIHFRPMPQLKREVNKDRYAAM